MYTVIVNRAGEKYAAKKNLSQFTEFIIFYFAGLLMLCFIC